MIDIIIPAYNAEKTIMRTLGSLMAQSVNNKFVVTLVNDASTDDTANIVNDFKKYLPIRIIDKSINEGVGAARATGIENTDCDLIMFLDSDDQLLPYSINALAREINSKDFPSVVYSDFISEQNKREVVITGQTNITWFHGKIYRKSFLDKFNIQMPRLRYNEDSGFSTMVHELCNEKAYLPELTYYWSENPNSLTRSKEEFNLYSLPNFITAIGDAFKHIDNYKDIYDMMSFYGQINNMYHYYMDLVFQKKDNTALLTEVENTLQEYFIFFWKEHRINDSKLIKAFNAPPPHEITCIPFISQLEFINKFAQKNYTINDFI